MLKETYSENSRRIAIKHDTEFDRMKASLIRGKLIRTKIDDIQKRMKEQVERFDSWLGYIARKRVFKNKPIIDNRIVFYTFQGTYTCNSKYIAEKLLEEYPDYEVIFAVNKKAFDRDTMNAPSNVKFVVKDSAAAFYVLGTAKYWVDNALCCAKNRVPKRKGQIYINTWHGSLGIKQLGGDEEWKRIAHRSNKEIDYFVTNSTFEENVFLNSFWPDVKQLKFGHPRNDIFFDNEKMEILKKKLLKSFRLDENTKIALYAPTFRDDKTDVSAIVIDYERLKTALEEKFGGNWVIFVRPHFHNAKLFRLREKADYIIDVTDYDDMQELLAVADVGITDYSSWIFDYVLTRRPAFIFARDIEKYVNDRGFYYPLSETPFTIAADDEILARNIKEFNEEQYLDSVERFLKDKGCYEKGTASEAVVKFIVENTKR